MLDYPYKGDLVIQVSLDPLNSFPIRETHGSGSAYHKELSKELATFLDNPLQVS